MFVSMKRTLLHEPRVDRGWRDGMRERRLLLSIAIVEAALTNINGRISFLTLM